MTVLLGLECYAEVVQPFNSEYTSSQQTLPQWLQSELEGADIRGRRFSLPYACIMLCRIPLY